MQSFFIIGCGYVGRRLAEAAQQTGHSVGAAVRTKESAQRLQAMGISARCLDLDQEPIGDIGLDNSVLIYLAPPQAEGNNDERLTSFLRGFSGQVPQRLIYMSTTGVYGDCQGEWVSETRQPSPGNARARRRLNAEQQLNGFARARGVELVILRVAGIYGPGRLPRKRLEAGEPVLEESEAPISNRIQVDDLVRVLMTTAVSPQAAGIYNVSDGQPSSMTEYLSQVATALKLPQPKRISAEDMDGQISAGMQSYLAESRRLDNRRLVDDLGVDIRYTDLAAGLEASLAQE